MSVTLPNFLIVGTLKSGTTSLYHYLRQHPEVFMPNNKEPRYLASSFYENMDPTDPHYEFYNQRTIHAFENYAKLFEEVRDERAIGEATAAYLYHYELTIPHIKRLLGNARIIAILRNPIDRAFSAYLHLQREQFEALPFERCLELEEERKAANWSPLHLYKDVGLYYRQVKAYMDNFETKILLYDDFSQDVLGLTAGVFDFLEVDPTFIPDVSVKYNVTGVPKNRYYYEFLGSLLWSSTVKSVFRPVVKVVLPAEKRSKLYKEIRNLRTKGLVKPEMKPETRGYLRDVFMADILKLQDLINRDLSHWLN